MNAAQWQALLFYAVAAMGMLLSLYLFVTLKYEIRIVFRRHLAEQQRVGELETALGQARLAMEKLEKDLREVERQTGMLVAPPPARSGLNLSKRTQVLRMHRSGQDSAAIAAALSLPRAEVDLLVKVHRIVVQKL